MLKIAITGNIAAGKTQVENTLSKYFKVFDTDKIAHNKLNELKEFYGYDVFTNGKIDRKKLGELVFNNPDLRSKLENLMHPLIKKEVLNIFENYKNEEVIFISVPLLFETDFYQLFDKILFISADENIRLKRLQQRNNLSKTDALLRIKSQMPEEEKIKRANFIIKNDTTPEELEKNVLIFIRELHSLIHFKQA